MTRMTRMTEEKPGRSLVGFLRRHTLWAGFAAALLPLLVLFGFQIAWLKRLQETTAIARRAALDNYLESVGNDVQYFYRGLAERTLNVPADLFLDAQPDRLAALWTQKPIGPVGRLFTVDFTRSPYGEYRLLDPDSGRLLAFPANDEAMAMIAAATPWQMRAYRSAPYRNAAILVDERNPDFRIILNPITDAESRVVALTGLVVDAGYFRKTLLPGLIAKSLHEFFPNNVEGDIEVFVKDAQGHVMVGAEDAADKALVVTSRFPFVFGDWTLVLHSHRSTPERLARANFAINVTLVALLAAVLMGGIALALRTADRAMRLSQMKSDFVSNVSHELRTPIASIRVFAELLRLGRVQTPEKVREYGEYIEREGRRLSRLIENILDFARIESGRKTYAFAPVDVRQVVETTLQSFEPHLLHSGFTCSLTVPDAPLPSVRADADALGQAIHNLLDNAVKYSGEARAIEVRLALDGGEVVVAVADRGVGIAREEQARIFERFHRVGTGLVHEVKGSGLGLSLVQHIMQVHGGRVTVESEPGKGSTFALHLPVGSAA
jgi:two-component system phosphate regulon sensor histidine kinase PhoR